MTRVEENNRRKLIRRLERITQQHYNVCEKNLDPRARKRCRIGTDSVNWAFDTDKKAIARAQGMLGADIEDYLLKQAAQRIKKQIYPEIQRGKNWVPMLDEEAEAELGAQYGSSRLSDLRYRLNSTTGNYEKLLNGYERSEFQRTRRSRRKIREKIFALDLHFSELETKKRRNADTYLDEWTMEGRYPWHMPITEDLNRVIW